MVLLGYSPKEMVPYGATVLSYLGCNLPGLIMTNSLLLNMAIEIVNFPMKHGDFSILVMLNYQRVYHVNFGR